MEVGTILTAATWISWILFALAYLGIIRVPGARYDAYGYHIRENEEIIDEEIEDMEEYDAEDDA